jgi:hypothetical protein
MKIIPIQDVKDLEELKSLFAHRTQIRLYNIYIKSYKQFVDLQQQYKQRVERVNKNEYVHQWNTMLYQELQRF